MVEENDQGIDLGDGRIITGEQVRMIEVVARESLGARGGIDPDRMDDEVEVFVASTMAILRSPLNASEKEILGNIEKARKAKMEELGL